MAPNLIALDEVIAARRSLNAEDQGRIDDARALRAFALVLNMRARNGPKDSVRFTLSELCIGAQGQQERRQKVYRAYWRLLVRFLRHRECRAARAEKRRITR